MTGTPHVVSDVMTHTVLALRPGAAFKDIVKALQHWQVSAAPVLDDDGGIAGVVSEADLLRKEEAHGDARGRRLEPARTKAAALTAEDLMTAPAVTVRLEATLPEAARTMARDGVKRLPVVDADGLLKGVVSRADLLKVFLRDDEEIAEEIRREIVPHLFADAAEPVGVRVDGVVAVECALACPRRRPDLDPDLPGAEHFLPDRGRGHRTPEGSAGE
ncbi:CBS domain-containing protein [Streptomyces sp. NPDC002763]|uniref:CBS domain-containing protein n=1 Tax=Streptomyces sp. NPDC002763 TaxID=3154427 RepID=UPI003329FBF7